MLVPDTPLSALDDSSRTITVFTISLVHLKQCSLALALICYSSAWSSLLVCEVDLRLLERKAGTGIPLKIGSKSYGLPKILSNMLYRSLKQFVLSLESSCRKVSIYLKEDSWTSTDRIYGSSGNSSKQLSAVFY